MPEYQIIRVLGGFYVGHDGDAKEAFWKEVEAGNLELGDKLVRPTSMDIVLGTENPEYHYTVAVHRGTDAADPEGEISGTSR